MAVLVKTAALGHKSVTVIPGDLGHSSTCDFYLVVLVSEVEVDTMTTSVSKFKT